MQQELRSLLLPEHQVATLLTMIVVDPQDPAFANPTKFHFPYPGPVVAEVPSRIIVSRWILA